MILLHKKQGLSLEPHRRIPSIKALRELCQGGLQEGREAVEAAMAMSAEDMDRFLERG